jgi:opacity protein-like surface antigen
MDSEDTMPGRLFSLLMLVLIIPMAAHAQTLAETHRRWELGIFGGTSTISNRNSTVQVAGNSGQASRTVKMEFASGSDLGIRVMENLGQHWAAALEYSFSNQPLKLSGLSDPAPSFHLKQSVHRISYDILYLPRSRYERLRPFVFAGPGVALFYVRENSRSAASALNMNLTSPWKATFNWGGGAKYLFMNHLAAAAQITDSISTVPRYGLPKAASLSSNIFTPGFNPSGLMHNWRLSAGFVYEWDPR